MTRSVEWFQDGEVWRVSVDGSLSRCVSCNQPIEYTGERGAAKHHCSRRHEGAKRAAVTRGEQPLDREVSVWQRLRDGFEMM